MNQWICVTYRDDSLRFALVQCSACWISNVNSSNGTRVSIIWSTCYSNASMLWMYCLWQDTVVTTWMFIHPHMRRPRNQKLLYTHNWGGLLRNSANLAHYHFKELLTLWACYAVKYSSSTQNNNIIVKIRVLVDEDRRDNVGPSSAYTPSLWFPIWGSYVSWAIYSRQVWSTFSLTNNKRAYFYYMNSKGMNVWT